MAQVYDRVHYVYCSQDRIAVVRHGSGRLSFLPMPTTALMRSSVWILISATRARPLDHIACALRSRPRQLFSGATLCCPSKALAEQARASKELDKKCGAYPYYRVGEELDLDLDLRDPRLGPLARHFACALRSRPRQLFSGAARSCASRVLAEQAGANKDLEQMVLWLRELGAFSNTRKIFCATVLICSMPRVQ
jgi:hypothetical protein